MSQHSQTNSFHNQRGGNFFKEDRKGLSTNMPVAKAEQMDAGKCRSEELRERKIRNASP